MKAIHPLGKSPVIEDNGLVIAESGAITEYLIQTYGANLAPKRLKRLLILNIYNGLHFAESSAILPLLLKMFVAKDGAKTNFLEGYADVEAEKVIGYFEQRLEGKTYLVEERLTGADIMMSFIAEILQNNGMISHYPNIQRYQAQLATHDKFVTAEQVEHPIWLKRVINR